MAVNEYDNPLIAQAKQSYVSQHVDLPYQQLAYAAQKKDKQFELGEQLRVNLEQDLLKAKALTIDTKRKNEIIHGYEQKIHDLIEGVDGDYSVLTAKLKGEALDYKKNLTRGELGAIQSNYNTRMAQQAKLEEQYQKGDIELEQMQTIMNYTDSKYNISGGVGAFDPSTGKYNVYQTEDAAKFIDGAELANKYAEGWKADLQKNTGWGLSDDGRFVVTTARGKEYVKPSEVKSAVKAMLKQNGELSSYVHQKSQMNAYNQTGGNVKAWNADVSSLEEQMYDQYAGFVAAKYGYTKDISETDAKTNAYALAEWGKQLDKIEAAGPNMSVGLDGLEGDNPLGRDESEVNLTLESSKDISQKSFEGLTDLLSKNVTSPIEAIAFKTKIANANAKIKEGNFNDAIGELEKLQKDPRFTDNINSITSEIRNLKKARKKYNDALSLQTSIEEQAAKNTNYTPTDDDANALEFIKDDIKNNTSNLPKTDKGDYLLGGKEFSATDMQNLFNGNEVKGFKMLSSPAGHYLAEAKTIKKVGTRLIGDPVDLTSGDVGISTRGKVSYNLVKMYNAFVDKQSEGYRDYAREKERLYKEAGTFQVAGRGYLRPLIPDANGNFDTPEAEARSIDVQKMVDDYFIGKDGNININALDGLELDGNTYIGGEKFGGDALDAVQKQFATKEGTLKIDAGKHVLHHHDDATGNNFIVIKGTGPSNENSDVMTDFQLRIPVTALNEKWGVSIPGYTSRSSLPESRYQHAKRKREMQSGKLKEGTLYTQAFEDADDVRFVTKNGKDIGGQYKDEEGNWGEIIPIKDFEPQIKYLYNNSPIR